MDYDRVDTWNYLDYTDVLRISLTPLRVHKKPLRKLRGFILSKKKRDNHHATKDKYKELSTIRVKI